MDTPDLARPAPTPVSRIRDASGYAVFSSGSLGEAHVHAHRCLDAGRLREGHEALGVFLRGRQGAGSSWVHLQWHQMVFELGLGMTRAGFDRFRAHVAGAIADGLARSDGPSALWRLRLAGVPGDALADHWATAARVAAGHQGEGASPWARLHDLMAFAGAGDLDAVDAWLGTPPDPAWTSDERGVVRLLVRGLRALVLGDREAAAVRFDAALPRIAHAGGSRAQSELFAALRDHAVEGSGAALSLLAAAR